MQTPLQTPNHSERSLGIPTVGTWEDKPTPLADTRLLRESEHSSRKPETTRRHLFPEWDLIVQNKSNRNYSILFSLKCLEHLKH